MIKYDSHSVLFHRIINEDVSEYEINDSNFKSAESRVRPAEAFKIKGINLIGFITPTPCAPSSENRRLPLRKLETLLP